MRDGVLFIARHGARTLTKPLWAQQPAPLSSLAYQLRYSRTACCLNAGQSRSRSCDSPRGGRSPTFLCGVSLEKASRGRDFSWCVHCPCSDEACQGAEPAALVFHRAMITTCYCFFFEALLCSRSSSRRSRDIWARRAQRWRVRRPRWSTASTTAHASWLADVGCWQAHGRPDPPPWWVSHQLHRPARARVGLGFSLSQGLMPCVTLGYPQV